MNREKEVRSKLIGRTAGDHVFDAVNTIILLLLCVVTLYPMYFVICASFTKNTYLLTHQGSLFWPVGFNVGSYRLAFTHPLLLSGFKNIMIVMVVSLPINIVLTLF